MTHHHLFTALAESYPANSIWLLDATGERRIEWWEMCLVAMQSGFKAAGANPDGPEGQREAFWAESVRETGDAVGVDGVGGRTLSKVSRTK